MANCLKKLQFRYTYIIYMYKGLGHKKVCLVSRHMNFFPRVGRSDFFFFLYFFPSTTMQVNSHVFFSHKLFKQMIPF